jgi:hypothetical protein
LAGLAVVGLWLCAAGSASAGLITYTFSGSGDVDLGASYLYPTSFTITVTADTAEITGGSGSFTVAAETATVSVAGLGSGTVTEALDVYAFNAGPSVGLSVSGDPFLYLDVLPNPVFNNYDLSTAVAPATGSFSFVNNSLALPTTAGEFSIFFQTPGSQPTFSAVFPATAAPEPASLTLLGIGVAGIALGAWRRRPLA